MAATRGRAVTLAELEVARREALALDRLATTHLHRASLTDGACHWIGRPAIVEAGLADTAHGMQRVDIGASLADMVAATITVEARSWRAHRWVRREAGWIVAETLVEDGRAAALRLDPDAEATRIAAAAGPAHPPLGELHAGRGQHAATDHALLPPDASEGARATADLLHRIVNARALADIDRLDPVAKRARRLRERLIGWLAAMPDLTLLFERAVAEDGTTALLFRLVGHQAGRRLRATGSLVTSATIGCDFVFDDLMIAAELRRVVAAP